MSLAAKPETIESELNKGRVGAAKVLNVIYELFDHTGTCCDWFYFRGMEAVVFVN